MAQTALSTYAKISAQRSLIFSRLANDLLDLLPSSLSSSIRIVSKKGKEREGSMSLPISRIRRLFYGERSITFQRGAVAIVISWDIKIDSLGFAGSDLAVAPRIPLNCISIFDRY